MVDEHATPFRASELPYVWRLIRIRGKHPYELWIAGPPRSFWMHWCPLALRTQPCIFGECHHCSDHSPRRPLSYVPVLYFGEHNGGITWRRAVLEVPLRTGLQLADMRDRGVSLLRRSTCGVIDIQAVAFRTRPENAQAWDIMPQLQALWRIARSEQLSLVSGDTV
jgi:hypothetical protein